MPDCTRKDPRSVLGGKGDIDGECRKVKWINSGEKYNTSAPLRKIKKRRKNIPRRRRDPSRGNAEASSPRIPRAYPLT